MEKPSPEKLFEEALEDSGLAAEIESAVPGQPMTADQFKAWLSAQ